MQPINIVGFETIYGFRTIELYEDDIARLSSHVDVLVISAFAGSYIPVPASVIQSLEEARGIVVEDLAYRPAIDLRDALGIWISADLGKEGIGRIVCVELRGGSRPISETLDNV